MLPKNNSTNTILGSFTSFVDINQGMATSPDPYLEDWDRQFEQFFNGKLPSHGGRLTHPCPSRTSDYQVGPYMSYAILREIERFADFPLSP